MACAVLGRGMLSTQRPKPGESRRALPNLRQVSGGCILGPETGAPNLAKSLVADLAGLVPV
jgi:hypothetical protein